MFVQTLRQNMTKMFVLRKGVDEKGDSYRVCPNYKDFG